MPTSLGEGHAGGMRPSRLFPWISTLSVVVGLAAAWFWWRVPSEAPRAPKQQDVAVRVLHDWDARRARAWASADTSGLRDLYTLGSGAGRRDVEALRAWRDRGWRVEGLGRQVRRFEVVAADQGAVTVRLTDRLVGAVARQEGRERRLPVGEFRERTLRWQRIAGVWRLAGAT